MNTNNDWNLIIANESERDLDKITSNTESVNCNNAIQNTIEKIKRITTDELVSLEESKLKRKITALNVKALKRNKITQIPNLNTRSNKLHILRGQKTTDMTSSTKNKSSKDIMDKLRIENRSLKIEIQKLQRLLEENTNNTSTTITHQQIVANTITQNRFAVLNESTNPQDLQEEPMDCQLNEDFETYLKKKNTQKAQDFIDNKNKKIRYSDKTDATTIHARQPNNRASTSQIIRRDKKEKTNKPPPINIFFQDAKDTASLLKNKLKDANNFYIKRNSSGKHSLYLDNTANYKIAIDLLTRCNSKFYIYTNKSEKPINILLKGLEQSYQEKEVLEELQALNIENVSFNKVIRFTTSKSRNENII